MFKIGDFSRLTQVTVKALRHYDRLGLLAPESIDPETGYRYYSGAQVSRLNRIRALKDLGFSLEQIGQLLDADLSPAQLHGMLLVKRDEVRGAIAAEQARLERIAERLRELDVQPDYPVTIKDIPAQRVAAIRATLPQHRAIGVLFGELAAYRERHGIRADARLAIWHDTEYRDADVDAEAALISADPLPPDGRVRPRDLPAVPEMACVTHRGPLATIGGAYIALLGWVEANDYQLVGPTRTFPHAFDGTAGDNAVIEIQYPVTRDGDVTTAVHQL